MSKVKRTSFKKGVSGNPKGRPKGVFNKDNILRVEFMKKAFDDLPSAYEELRQSMRAGEGWAHTLFFKTIIPQRTFQHIANINLSIDRLQANLEGLKEFNGLTHDEIISEIKALTNVKLAEKIEHFEVAKTEEEQKILMNKLEFILADSPDFADFLEWKKEKYKNAS